MNKSNYVPAHTGILTSVKKINYVPAQMQGIFENKKYDSYKLSWWEQNSFYYYKRMLITAYYGMKWKNFREVLGLPDDFILIGDSGGFQNMTQKSVLNPIDVLKWQEQNCQIGLTFDLPILGSDPITIKRDKQKQTAINAEIALQNRTNQKLKLYAVFQGHTVKDQEYMLDAYKQFSSGLEKFDGVAIGGLVPISGNVEKLVKVLTLFCYHIKDLKKPVHFFGLSGSKIIPYIIYLQKKFDLEITFDSSSYGAGAIRREFWTGNGLQKLSVMSSELEDIPCDCPVCSKVQKMSEYQKPGSIAGGLISLHNLYQTLEHVEKVNKVNPKIDKDYKRFIDIMEEKGINEAFLFMPPLEEDSGIKQTSLLTHL